MALCDGCNVTRLWEHRCHGANVCDCQECRELDNFKAQLEKEEIGAPLSGPEDRGQEFEAVISRSEK